MAFVKLMCTASKLKKLKSELEEEKTDAIKISHKEKPKTRLRHFAVNIRLKFKKLLKKVLECFCCHIFCYKLRHYGSCENYVLKSIIGFLGGFILTYIFFMFFVFQLNFKITTATIMCSILGCILMIGLAFSTRVRYPEKPQPDLTLFKKLKFNLSNYGSYTKPRSKIYNKANREEQENVTLQCVRQNPNISSREIEVNTGVKRNTALRFLKKHKFRPYKIRVNHHLYAADFNRRLEFCNWLIHKYNQNPAFTEVIMWTDESYISNDGIFNRYNNHHYAQDNPYATATRNRQGRYGFSVWCCLINNQLIAPHFFHGNLNAALYIEILENNVMPYLDNAPLANFPYLYFQQDGAPAHNARQTTAYLDELLPGKWIGTNGPVRWPARSCDITPLDFWLWGCLKNIIYKERSNNLQELMERTRAAFQTITPVMIRNATSAVIKHCQACIAEEGRCIVLLTLPQFFSQKGRQALLAYAFILAISGPAKNTLNNMGILSESLACGQEQLKEAVRQIIDVIKKPFLAIKEAIKKVIKTVKEIVKKIKEILLKIKRIIMAIIRVIKAAFSFLAKIINICNKELGTPFERCSRVFENAIADCNAKLGPMFNWLCSITYIVKSVCYIVKIFDLVCIIVDFISDSIIGVVIRKVKSFIRHIRTMFYVRIKFSHSFQFQTNTSRTMTEVAHEVVAEIKERTQVLVAIFNFMTSAATLFFLFIIFKVIYYRYRFLTSERFDNKYITKDFREIDLRRAKLGKETVLPLNNREIQVYITIRSKRLIKTEKKQLSKSITTLATATLKLALYMVADYSLFWVLNLIKYYGRFQSKVQAPKLPSAHISGTGLLADLLKGIVKAFQPLGIQLEIDTVPCLPTPIPPDYDRYVQLATLILLCWILALLEPYGLRLRHTIMCYYHPTRAKQRSIWLYNHIMRSRNSFLKFARRQLRRKALGDKQIAKITCKEYLAANIKIFGICFGKGPQTACLLCGEVFRETDNKKPIKCQTPECPGVYCEQCFSDLQNLCTVCLSPIEYGDLSDISEEKDSSEEEPRKISEIKKRKRKKIFWCCGKCESLCTKKDDPKPENKTYKYSDTSSNSSEDEHIQTNLLRDDKTEEKPKRSIREIKSVYAVTEYKKRESDKLDKHKDSDYYSSDNSTDYSYTYQYDKDENKSSPEPKYATFKDVEKQEIPDYASMDSFREETTMFPTKKYAETAISGTTFAENKLNRHVDFIGVPSKSELGKNIKKGKNKRKEEEMPLIDPSLCFCSDTDEDDTEENKLFSTLLHKSTTSTLTPNLHSSSLISFSDERDVLLSDVDSEVKGDIQYLEMSVPNLDLSKLSETCACKHHLANKFSSVIYDEVSESPKSSSSSRNFSSSTNISSLKDDSPRSEKFNKSTDKYLVTEKSHSIIDTRKLASNLKYDYEAENNQKKKIKQYYKSIPKIPSKKTEEKRKSGVLKFLRKIIPKRKSHVDELPLHSRKDKSVEEIRSYDYSQKHWDSLNSSQISLKQPGTQIDENTVSPDEGEEHKRIRGGECFPPINPVKKQREIKEIRKKDNYLNENILDDIVLQNYSKFPISSKTFQSDLFSKYSFTIEDLTPTRDSEFSMNSVEASGPSTSYGGKRIIQEPPEKDTTSQDSTNTENFKSVDSQLLLTSNIQTSSSSYLSEGFCTSILGHPCGIIRGRRQEFCPDLPSQLSEHSKYNTTDDKSKQIRSVVSVTGSELEIRNSNPVIFQSSTPSEENNINLKQKSGNLSDLSNLNKSKFTNKEPNKESKSKRSIGNDRTEIPNEINLLNTKLKDKTSPESNSDNVSKTNLTENTCECTSRMNKQQITQTCPSPILKRTSQNIIASCKDSFCHAILFESVGIGTNENVGIATNETGLHGIRSNKDQTTETGETKLVQCRQKTQSTIDKMQQTSNNSISQPLTKVNITPNNSTSSKSTNNSNLRNNCPKKSSNYSELNKSDSYFESAETIQPLSSSDDYCGCRCSNRRILHHKCNYKCCKCAPPLPPPPPHFGDCISLREKSCRRLSPPKYERYKKKPTCSKYVRNAPSDYAIRSTSPVRRKIYRDYPAETEYSQSLSKYRSAKRSTSSHVSDNVNPRNFHSDISRSSRHQGSIIICSCNDECKCSPKQKTPQTSLSMHKYYPEELESSASESDTSEEYFEDDDYTTESGPNYYDLPYQNNEDYLELVQELEETLQTRNRNRVMRAMQEFEHRSKYNKPLEKPIIDYDETSESEEPLIEKITKLTTDKHRCCAGDSCLCKMESKKHNSKKNQPSNNRGLHRPRSRAYENIRRREELPPNFLPRAHWQMDKKTGEWFKVSKTQKYKDYQRSRTPSPQRDYCAYDCKCCASKKRSFK